MLLPKFFCVENLLSYKVFTNTVYNLLDKNISVVWPLENIQARVLTIKMRDDREKRTEYRKWNGRKYDYISWYFTGSSINMTLDDKGITINCPVINVSDINLLPFNSCSIKPSIERFIDENDYSSYEKADVYAGDPNSPEYTAPLLRSSEQVQIYPYASFNGRNPMVAVATPVAVPRVRKGLPTHIANLVLADIISKNEVCPISSETITKENASVTSCGHVFCKESIDTWLSTPASKGECPVCKQVCL